MSRHLHLDVLGGISGDMFLAAMLDTFPNFAPILRQDISDAGLDFAVGLTVATVKKAGFRASQVTFKIETDAPPTHNWYDIKKFINGSDLRDEVKVITLDIFTYLASAEAQCHSVKIDAVHFHEVADWDSLADIVGAASIIDQAAATWSVSALPLGSGRVKTQHGWIPVPAPATTLLLHGFEGYDDGVSGERITPTGAAILKYLEPAKAAPPGSVCNTGMGAGQKDFPNVANILRVLETTSTVDDIQQDMVSEIAFEIDDMTGEELAISVEYLRETEGVIDVGCRQELGKKGRNRTALRILALPAQQDSVIRACFIQTSTLGVRFSTVRRKILRRTSETHAGWPIKTANRPTGNTVKVESDALAPLLSLAERRKQARESEGLRDA
ncbi:MULTISPECIES: LarC family nickel insertion protein [Falsihalocynthiibacter]|uniref:LarC family nickel insertion protein n=1 Tax=Falsihalocynthiibacter TaxID=2854182 RepID=UPI003002AFD5